MFFTVHNKVCLSRYTLDMEMVPLWLGLGRRLRDADIEGMRIFRLFLQYGYCVTNVGIQWCGPPSVFGEGIVHTYGFQGSFGFMVMTTLLRWTLNLGIPVSAPSQQTGITLLLQSPVCSVLIPKQQQQQLCSNSREVTLSSAANWLESYAVLQNRVFQVLRKPLSSDGVMFGYWFSGNALLFD